MPRVVRRAAGPLLLASLALSLAVLWVHGGRASLLALARLPPWHLVLLLAMILGGWRFNAARVRLLARHLGLALTGRRALALVVAQEFAGSATPAGSGALPTMIYLLARAGLAPGRGAALLAVDVLADLVFFATVLPPALAIYLWGAGVNDPWSLGLMVLLLPALGVGALGLLVRYHRRLSLGLLRGLRILPLGRRWRRRLRRGLAQFHRATMLLLGLPRSRLAALYLLSAGHWLLRYGVLPVLLALLGASVPWSYAFMIQGLLMFGAQLLVLPGGGGGVELGFIALLGRYLDPATSALALLVWRFCTFYWYLIAGAPVFLWLTGRHAGTRYNAGPPISSRGT